MQSLGSQGYQGIKCGERHVDNFLLNVGMSAPNWQMSKKRIKKPQMWHVNQELVHNVTHVKCQSREVHQYSGILSNASLLCDFLSWISIRCLPLWYYIIMPPMSDQSSCFFTHRQSLFYWMASRTYFRWVLIRTTV